MKTSAIIRIVIYSLILVLLAGLLGIGLGVWDFGLGHLFSFGYTYPNSSSYQAGGSSVSAQGITELEITWVAGSVNIQVTEGDSITFRESPTVSEDNQLQYLVSGNRLILQYRKSGGFWGSIPAKDLTLEIPRSVLGRLNLVDIDTTSASLTVHNLEAQILEIDNVSGQVTLENCSLYSMDLDTTSGDLTFTGQAQDVSIDTVSGDARLDLQAVPSSLEFDSTSGDCEITLPKDASFSAEQDSVSGDFTSGFPMSKHGDTYSTGSGGGSFSFDTVSGDVSIQPAN